MTESAGTSRPSRPRASWARRAWQSRWGAIRLVIASFLLWAVAIDTPARLARLELAALPGFDYSGEVESLRLQGRYGEAIMVADAGLAADGEDALTPAQRESLTAQREKTQAEMRSWLRRARDVGLGAVSGTGTSLEGLLGAVAADFFIVGDVRDLVLQGGRLALDGETDEVILSLSAVGLVTTLAPEIDWAPSILKAARKAGTMSKRLAEQIVTLAKSRKKAELVRVVEDAAAISKRASPGGALRLLKHADDADELASIARFVERRPAGAFALHVTGEEGARLVKQSAKAGEAAVGVGETLAIKASRKGEAGRRFLSSKGARVLLKPHALVGLAKGLWKGNVASLAQRLVDRFLPNAWWLLPLLAAWVFVEGAMLVRRLFMPDGFGWSMHGHADPIRAQAMTPPTASTGGCVHCDIPAAPSGG